MQNRTFLIVAVVVIVIAAVALGSHRQGGGMLHRLGTAIHGR
ncbi:MAG TPA: hypothetical protein VF147_17415 [Vicinamibacterales bacterium]